MLSREDILRSVDLPTDTLSVPEWGGELRVRGVPFADSEYTAFIEGDDTVSDEVIQEAEALADAFLQALTADVAPDKRLSQRLARTKEMFRRELRRRFEAADEPERDRRRVVATVIMAVVDEDGERVFDWSDADMLRKRNYGVLNRIALEAARLSARTGAEDAATFPGGEPVDEASVSGVDQQAEPSSV